MRAPVSRGLRRKVYMPWARIPEGRMVELPGRGSTYVTDTPGPHPESPTIVLLHALGCTGLLTWYPAIEPLSRAVPGGHARPALARAGHPDARSSRWSTAPTTWPRCSTCSSLERGDRRRLLDGLDRRPAGLAPAPGPGRRAWCSARPPTGSRSTLPERAFFTGMGATMLGACAPSPGRGRRCTRPARPPRRWTSSPRHPGVGARASSAAPARGRSARRIAALGRHHSRPWLRQHRRADRGRGHQRRPRDPARPPARAGPRRSPAPPSTTSTPATPPACWRPRRSCPAFVEAVATVNARRRDFRSPSSATRPPERASVAQAAALRLRDRRRPPGCPATAALSRVQLGREALGQVVDVRHRLAAGDDPDVRPGRCWTSR